MALLLSLTYVNVTFHRGIAKPFILGNTGVLYSRLSAFDWASKPALSLLPVGWNLSTEQKERTKIVEQKYWKKINFVVWFISNSTDAYFKQKMKSRNTQVLKVESTEGDIELRVPLFVPRNFDLDFENGLDVLKSNDSLGFENLNDSEVNCGRFLYCKNCKDGCEECDPILANRKRG